MSDSIHISYYFCSKCNKQCKDKRGLAIHENKCGIVKEIKEFICLYCNVKFSTNQTLQHHTHICQSRIEQEKMKNYEEERKRLLKIINEQNEMYRLKEEKLDQERIRMNKEYDMNIREIVSEEKLKWMELHNTEIERRDDRIAKLDEENGFLRNVVNKVGLLSNNDKIIENESIIYSGTKSMEYVYIIQEREFVKEERPLYKIGRTTQKPYQRYSGYPKGSIEFICMSVSNSKIAEGLIKKVFSSKFKQDRDIGIEYFEGDIEEMKREFILLIDTKNKKNSKSV